MPLDSTEPATSPHSGPAFRISLPYRQTTPVVFASPHSGRDYPPRFLESTRLDAAGLRRSEDCFVDELFEGAAACGAPLVAATFARAYCDPNRERWELDPSMFDEALPDWVNTTSARVGAGLGTLARVVASGEAIYRRKLPFREAEHRVHTYWEPYHGALCELLEQTKRVFGACLLIDCHSMPTQAGGAGRPSPDIILGDAHGTACSAAIMRAAEKILIDLDFTVRRNDPYAGGFVTRHYGRPRERVHALQIEVARGLYMDETRLVRTAAFDALHRRLTVFTTKIGQQAASLLGIHATP